MLGNHPCIPEWQARPTRHYTPPSASAWLNTGNTEHEHRREQKHRRCREEAGTFLPCSYKPLCTPEYGLYRRTEQYDTTVNTVSQQQYVRVHCLFLSNICVMPRHSTRRNHFLNFNPHVFEPDRGGELLLLCYHGTRLTSVFIDTDTDAECMLWSIR